ncbi:MAG: RluA family pseudouridine synthase [Xanthomonadales bacterium]|nr:RluA family pseudouridine synthase [Xanthomonadales bacterium]
MNNSDSNEQKRSGGVHYLTVKADQAGQRLDNFLHTYLKSAPRSLVYRLLRTGQVRVNGGRAKPTYRVKANDQLRIPPYAGAQGSVERKVPAAVLERVREAIVYEDKRQLVVNKPAGLVVHAGSGLGFGLVDALKALRPNRSVQLAHRLDRGTSGLVLATLDAEALRQQQQAFQRGQVGKYYMALLHGRLPEDKVLVDAPLLRSHDTGAEESVVVDYEQGKASRTQFKVLERLKGYTLAEVKLETGRTHQIRAHAAHLGLPLAGDERYCEDALLAKDYERGLKRMFLHAHRLDLQWPEEDILVSAPLTDDLHQFIENIA